MNKKNDYLKKPNLMKVACELATYENPYRVADSMLSLIKSCMDNSANPQDNLSLLVGDVVTLSNEPH